MSFKREYNPNELCFYIPNSPLSAFVVSSEKLGTFAQLDFRLHESPPFQYRKPKSNTVPSWNVPISELHQLLVQNSFRKHHPEKEHKHFGKPRLNNHCIVNPDENFGPQKSQHFETGDPQLPFSSSSPVDQLPFYNQSILDCEANLNSLGSIESLALFSPFISQQNLDEHNLTNDSTPLDSANLNQNNTNQNLPNLFLNSTHTYSMLFSSQTNLFQEELSPYESMQSNTLTNQQLSGFEDLNGFDWQLDNWTVPFQTDPLYASTAPSQELMLTNPFDSEYVSLPNFDSLTASNPTDVSNVPFNCDLIPDNEEKKRGYSECDSIPMTLTTPQTDTFSDDDAQDFFVKKFKAVSPDSKDEFIIDSPPTTLSRKNSTSDSDLVHKLKSPTTEESPEMEEVIQVQLEGCENLSNEVTEDLDFK